MSVHTVSLAWQRRVETQSKSSFSQDISEVLTCGTPDSSGLRRVCSRGLPRQYDLRGARRAACSRQSPSFVVVAATAETVCVNSSLWWDSVGGRGFKTKRWGISSCKHKPVFSISIQIAFQRLPALSRGSVDLGHSLLHSQAASWMPLPGEEGRRWCLSLCTYISGLAGVLCLPSAEWLALTDHAFQGRSSPTPLPLPCGLGQEALPTEAAFVLRLITPSQSVFRY